MMIKKNRPQWLISIVIGASMLALFVVMLGAYTRLTHAGLGCPDWPGCYGKLVLPAQSIKLNALQHHYPQTPIELTKAWTEMAHRYVAGILVCLIIIINLWVVRYYFKQRYWLSSQPFLLLLLVAFQAALGMWTVTLKLSPLVVMSHLMGGMLIFAGLIQFYLQLSALKGQANSVYLHRFISLGIVILLVQIALGGWVSANYAGIACAGFPRCNNQWLPQLDINHGFNLLSSVGSNAPDINYQGGVLENQARITIAFAHRVGAVVTALYLLALSSVITLKNSNKLLKIVASALGCLVVVQFSLGILNVIYLLPINIAVAHNGTAALLLATMFSLFHLTKHSGIKYE